MTNLSLNKARVNLITLVIISSFVLFFHLGSNRLQSWDEAIYAQSAKEMVRTGDWLTPHWNGEHFYQKPPLTIWVTALLFHLFGVSELTARIFAAICGVACVLLVSLIGQLFLSHAQALIAGLVLLATPHFNYYARQGSMDVPLTAFLLLGFYFYLRSKDNPRYWIATGVAMALAVLTKGAAAGPGILALGVAVLLNQDRPWRVREAWIGCAVFFVLAGSWHAGMIIVHGRAFWSEYFVSQVFSRSVSTFDTNASGPLAYFVTVFLGFLPFIPLLILGIIRIWKVRPMFPVALLLFAGMLFVLYSLVPTKHPWYLVPIYPTLSLIACCAPRVPRLVMAIMLLCAVAYSVMLDQAIPSLHPTEPKIIEQARQSTGPLDVPINIAPAVLFYTDRKICTETPDHSMGRMTRCNP
jgi:4-amino-4-deoxy-L-arabinose transferase-like glycosyltransferase